MSTPAPQPQTGGGQSFDLGIGTGPIGPLGLAFALWFARRARKQS
jgi:hypothetical protein